MQRRIVLRAGLALLSLALSSAAHALLFRTYLSSDGSDSNPCSLQQPCRLLPAALAAVINRGEVWILDSANYNTATVNITRSVSILALPGVAGGVVALGGPAINISTAGVSVSLRNLMITPVQGSGATHGIVMTSGANLTVHETLIADLQTGIDVDGAIRVRVMDSTIRNGTIGLFLRGGAVAAITNSKVVGNSSYGVYVHGGAGSAATKATIDDSLLSSNLTGLYAHAPFGTTAVWTAARTSAPNNGTGFACGADVGGTATCTVGFSMATGNSAFGFWNGGATFRSMGNNIVIDNGTNIEGAITPSVSP